MLQGGGALGSYQAGVYNALHEAGIEPDWVIGTSIARSMLLSLQAIRRSSGSNVCAHSGTVSSRTPAQMCRHSVFRLSGMQW